MAGEGNDGRHKVALKIELPIQIGSRRSQPDGRWSWQDDGSVLTSYLEDPLAAALLFE